MELPDGYRWAGDGIGMVLIDPETCPAGHPIVRFTRGGVTHCSGRGHGPHLVWTCACGQQIWRWRGAFWGELECLSSLA